MKILHTADWHIGQNFVQQSRDEEFKLFFNWLIDCISSNEIDVLLIAGDIFDVGYPSNHALNLFYDFLTSILKTNCRNVIITAGNHDAISTLNAPKEILKYLDIHIVASVTENADNEIIEIKNSNKETELVICATPYLRDRDIRQSKAGETYEERTKAIKDGIIKHYDKVAVAAQKYKDQNIPVIAMGHLYAAGVSNSDSERDIHIGNLGNVDAKQFPELFDYIALGHIHRPQIVASCNHIRYSGSPLQLSFSERKDTKKVIRIETVPNSPLFISEIEVPQFRKLNTFKGKLEEIEFALKSYSSNSPLIDWGEVIIEEEKYDTAIVSKYEEIIDNLSDITILKFHLNILQETKETGELFEAHTSLKDIEVEDVFDKLLEQTNNENQKEMKLTFKELVESLDK